MKKIVIRRVNYLATQSSHRARSHLVRLSAEYSAPHPCALLFIIFKAPTEIDFRALSEDRGIEFTASGAGFGVDNDRARQRSSRRGDCYSNGHSSLSPLPP